MRQPMEICLAGGCVRPLWRNGVERPEHGEKRCAEHHRPRKRIDGVGNGVADPGEGTKSLLEVGGRQGRTESNTGPFESIEVGRIGTVERKVGVAADGGEVGSRSRHRKHRQKRRLARKVDPQNQGARTVEERCTNPKFKASTRKRGSHLTYRKCWVDTALWSGGPNSCLLLNVQNFGFEFTNLSAWDAKL